MGQAARNDQGGDVGHGVDGAGCADASQQQNTKHQKHPVTWDALEGTLCREDGAGWVGRRDNDRGLPIGETCSKQPYRRVYEA